MLVGTRLMGKMGYGNFRSGFLLVAGGLNMKNCFSCPPLFPAVMLER